MNGKDYLSVGEMSSSIGISYSALDSWIRKGFITPAFVTPTGRKLFSPEQVTAYFNGEYSKKN